MKVSIEKNGNASGDDVVWFEFSNGEKISAAIASIKHMVPGSNLFRYEKNGLENFCYTVFVRLIDLREKTLPDSDR